MPKYIDLTPTWAGLMPGLLLVLEAGTDAGKQIAREELFRLAKGMDELNAQRKVA